ncbi:MAG: Mini-ribonuclease 3 [Lawsonibacter sp.]|nr:ribonuclease III [Oscillospiraceae bacterium]
MDYFKLDMPRDELLSMSSLGLAHLGDGVFEVMVRSWLCLRGKARPRDLHRATVKYVSAPAQAAAIERLLPILTEQEADVYRRGRNTAPHSVPKAASRAQYQSATGLEALFGWLYLQGRTDRLNELFQCVMEPAESPVPDGGAPHAP